jgi:acyl-coenzyme A thioesterase PaaI-like protein
MTAAIKPTTEQLADFLKTEFPQNRTIILAAGDMGATVKVKVGFGDLRPGNTISGPTMMALADVALYVAILGEIGIVPLAVTTSLSFNFLRKPKADRDLVGVCKLIKLGRTLAVGDVNLYSEGDTDPVAHAVGTYAIPAKRT